MKMNDPAKAKEFFQNKLDFTVGPFDVNNKIKEGVSDYTVIDLRMPEDYKAGHIPGAVNLPKDQWATLKGLQKDKMNILYCYSQTCHLAARAALEFADKGFSVVEMEGGFNAWKEANNKVESPETASANGGKRF